MENRLWFLVEWVGMRKEADASKSIVPFRREYKGPYSYVVDVRFLTGRLRTRENDFVPAQCVAGHRLGIGMIVNDNGTLQNWPYQTEIKSAESCGRCDRAVLRFMNPRILRAPPSVTLMRCLKERGGVQCSPRSLMISTCWRG